MLFLSLFIVFLQTSLRQSRGVEQVGRIRYFLVCANKTNKTWPQHNLQPSLSLLFSSGYQPFSDGEIVSKNRNNFSPLNKSFVFSFLFGWIFQSNQQISMSFLFSKCECHSWPIFEFLNSAVDALDKRLFTSFNIAALYFKAKIWSHPYTKPKIKSISDLKDVLHMSPNPKI